jgi:hypothetical protein
MTSVIHLENAMSNSTILTLNKVAHALGQNLRDLIPDEAAVAEMINSAS